MLPRNWVRPTSTGCDFHFLLLWPACFNFNMVLVKPELKVGPGCPVNFPACGGNPVVLVVTLLTINGKWYYWPDFLWLGLLSDHSVFIHGMYQDNILKKKSNFLWNECLAITSLFYDYRWCFTYRHSVCNCVMLLRYKPCQFPKVSSMLSAISWASSNQVVHNVLLNSWLRLHVSV